MTEQQKQNESKRNYQGCCRFEQYSNEEDVLEEELIAGKRIRHKGFIFSRISLQRVHYSQGFMPLWPQ